MIGRRRRITWSLLCISLGLIILLGQNIFSNGGAPRHLIFSPASLDRFVTRAGTQLLLDGQPFRFAGANMHWLPFDDSTQYTSQFRINDGLDTAKEMGLTVIRALNMGISVGCSHCIEPALGIFNETALSHDDYVIKAAKEHGLRLIIPFTDNYYYPAGGKHTFTDWRSLTDENQFYFNTQVITDFETYIKTLLNHVNVYTGIAYKDDPTVLAWETGNELVPPARWTQIISTYIKSIDHNHLVMDGRYGIDPYAASLTNVDIVSDHYYPKNLSKLSTDIKAAQRARKAFIVGEFDWNDTNGGDPLRSFLANVQTNSAVAGDLFWELWPHSDEYGYIHQDLKYDLHYPGDTATMRSSLQLLRLYAYKMSNQLVPAYSIPGAPSLEVIIREGTENVLIWKGVAAAASYTIERSSASATGPWTVICNQCATDNDIPWVDRTPSIGPLWYRVTANNLSGIAGSPSSPYQAEAANLLIDNLNDWSKVYQHSSNLTLDTTYSQYMHDDYSRATRTAATHEYIIWKQTNMTSFQAITYFWPDESVSHFSIYTSEDQSNWTLACPSITEIYGNWLEYVYTLNGLSNVNYVKMVWNNTGGQIWNPNLGEVTMSY